MFLLLFQQQFYISWAYNIANGDIMALNAGKNDNRNDNYWLYCHFIWLFTKQISNKSSQTSADLKLLQNCSNKLYGW